MTFFVICFGLIALISWKCWVDDQIWRKWLARQFQEDFEATTMERYEQFEVTVRDMINALTPSPNDRAARSPGIAGQSQTLWSDGARSSQEDHKRRQSSDAHLPHTR